MKSVSAVRKVEPFVVAPTVTPRKMVTMFISSFCAVLDRRSVTPETRRRLPNISMPISGAAEGSSSETMTVTAMGKITSSRLLTGRSCCMTMERSFLVVNARMMGGWMTGTSAM